MTGMASEMARRLAEDQGAGMPNAPAEPVSTPVGTAAGGVPGNEGGNATPAAEPSNTEIVAPGTTPDTIPYARFKEVNDRYTAIKGFERLVEFGYAPDSLERLAAFEAAYQADPVGTLATMAGNLELPQEIQDAIKAHAEGASTAPSGAGSGPAEGAPSGNGATPIELPADVKERLDYVDQLRAREAEQAQEAQLNRVVAAWDSMDKQDGIDTPLRIKLAHISATAGSGQRFGTIEELASNARSSLMEYRSTVLGDAVIRTGPGGLPPALPGSPPVATPPVSFGGNMKAATKAAMAAIQRGELPG